jgi:hypothetical protein
VPSIFRKIGFCINVNSAHGVRSLLYHSSQNKWKSVAIIWSDRNRSIF